MAWRLLLQCRTLSFPWMLHKPICTTNALSQICFCTSSLARENTSVLGSITENENILPDQRLVTNTLEFVLRESLCRQQQEQQENHNTNNNEHQKNNSFENNNEEAKEGEVVNYRNNSNSSDDNNNYEDDVNNNNKGSVSNVTNKKEPIGLTRKQINSLVMASLAKQGITNLSSHNQIKLLRNAWEAMSVYCYYVNRYPYVRARYTMEKTNKSELQKDNIMRNNNGAQSAVMEQFQNVANTNNKQNEEYCYSNYNNNGNDNKEDDIIYWLDWNEVMCEVVKEMPNEGMTEFDFVQCIQQHCPLFKTTTSSSSFGNITTTTTTNTFVNPANGTNNNIVTPEPTSLFSPFIFSHKKCLAEWIDENFSQYFLVTRSAVTHLPLYHSRCNNNNISDNLNTSSFLYNSETSSTLESNSTCKCINYNNNNNNNNSNNKPKKMSNKCMEEELANALEFALCLTKGQEQAHKPEWTDLKELLPFVPIHLRNQVVNWTDTLEHSCIRRCFDVRPFIGLHYKPTTFSVVVIVDLISCETVVNELKMLWYESCELVPKIQSGNTEKQGSHFIIANKEMESKHPHVDVCNSTFVKRISALKVLSDISAQNKFAVKVLCRHADMQEQIKNNSKAVHLSEKDYSNTLDVNNPNTIFTNSNSYFSSSNTDKQEEEHAAHEQEENWRSKKNAVNSCKIVSSNNVNNSSKQVEAVVIDDFLEVEHILGALMQTLQSNSIDCTTHSNKQIRNKGNVNCLFSHAMTNNKDNNMADENTLERIIILTSHAKRSTVESVLAEYSHKNHISVEVRAFDE